MSENQRARSLAPLPIIAFDGIQSERFPGQEVVLALAYAPTEGMLGVTEVRRAAELVVEAVSHAGDTLRWLRQLGSFDDHGDLLDPTVRFEPLY